MVLTEDVYITQTLADKLQLRQSNPDMLHLATFGNDAVQHISARSADLAVHLAQWRSWWGCLCGVCGRKGVWGLWPREKFSFSFPKQWGFVRFRLQERLQGFPLLDTTSCATLLPNF